VRAAGTSRVPPGEVSAAEQLGHATGRSVWGRGAAHKEKVDQEALGQIGGQAGVK
jgi:hypothetical protein